ncbi:MAG TPA: hypothetical protein VK439_06965, partial [Rubrivivax sp.]|nr:hypothetical protein [Rubrivivax sp.]
MQTKSLTAVALGALTIITAMPAWAQQPARSAPGAYESCYRSRHGAADQAGALNSITPARTLAATRLVKQGKAMRMGIETNSKTP